MVDIPPEIWLYITQFLPKEELYRLIPVNSLFFEVGMNKKWEFVKLSNTVVNRNEPSAIQVLKRLSDPFVASKLKTLYIDIDHLDPPSPNAPAEQVLMSSSYPTYDEIISGIVEAAPHFRNIQYVDLLSYTIPPSWCKPETRFQPMWSPIAQNLKTLGLGGHLGTYRVLIDSLPPTLPQLDNLHVFFMSNSMWDDSQLASDVPALITHVIPFINRTGPRLKTLSIYSWTNVDLSALFKNLHRLPLLRWLALSFHFNQSLEDPSELCRFFERCSDTISYLKLYIHADDVVGATNASAEPLTQWLLDLFTADNQCFINLQTLIISFRTYTEHAADILSACLRKTQATLHQLYVFDKVLDCVELTQLLSAAANCRQLKTLYISIDRLDWEVFDMIASKLPRIRRFFITADTLAIVSGALGPGSGLVKQSAAASALLECGVCNYLQWQLHVVNLWEGGGGRVEVHNMSAIV